MQSFKELQNPFNILSPEHLSVDDAFSLFVDVFSDFSKIESPCHSFLHGPRGSGKSMMFRYLLPDCQLKKREKSTVKDLPFFAVWIQLKSTDLKITDLARFKNAHADFIINEHLMVVYFAESIFDSFEKFLSLDVKFDLNELKSLFENVFCRRLNNCGHEQKIGSDKLRTAKDFFNTMKELCKTLSSETKKYLRQTSFTTELPPYEGALLGYLDFLYPVLCGLKELSSMPNGPIYLLVDDADNLNRTQTKILNSWVYTRTQANVSLKISTQLRYQTYRTINNQTIQTPHDFTETNISSVYTASSKNSYPERIKAIIKKRFDLFGIETLPEDFFPGYSKQESKIKEIADKYKAEDDPNAPYNAYRYSRPDYMKSLGGSSKSKNSYSYSGLKQLINLSSGIIRDFLEPASRMYDTFKARYPNKELLNIPHSLQNEIMREYSKEFRLDEHERLRKDPEISGDNGQIIEKLFKLIDVCGKTFGQILLSDHRSERRVISIVFYKDPSAEMQKLLDMGLEYGYFHLSTIGKKDGTSRLRQYVLSRTLAPFYYLDPTGFSGYLFVDEDIVWEAIRHPDNIIKRIRVEGADAVFKKNPTLFEI